MSCSSAPPPSTPLLINILFNILLHTPQTLFLYWINLLLLLLIVIIMMYNNQSKYYRGEKKNIKRKYSLFI